MSATGARGVRLLAVERDPWMWTLTWVAVPEGEPRDAHVVTGSPAERAIHAAAPHTQPDGPLVDLTFAPDGRVSSIEPSSDL